MKKLDNSDSACLLAGRLGLTGLFLWLTLLSNASVAQVTDEPVRRCANEILDRRLQQRFPERKRQIDALNEQIRAFGRAESVLESRARGTTEEVYRIPVVVHVIHNNVGGTIGGTGNANITDAQIQSQIDVLNEDYRKKAGTPGGASNNPLAVDTQIEFFLATTDPNGKPTSGITRTYANRRFDITDETDLFALSAISYWPSNQYLNIWTCPNSATDYLGYGQFPTVDNSQLPGLESITPERIDGLVVDHRYFGRQQGTVTSRLYCCGRTVTHEIGHWLGLYHPNGDTFCGDDFIADTPPIESLNQVTDTRCTPVFSTCNGRRTQNMIENYMDYTPDVCMNLFTGNQRDRMRAVLQLSARRRQVVQSATPLAETATLTLTVYPNPVSSSLSESTVDVQFRGPQAFDTTLFDATGRLIQSRSYPASLSRRVSLSGQGLPSGLYFLRVTTQNETATARVLVR